MTDGVVERARPRDRILETAQDMFHKHGIKGVGVDAITEAAGTNKMTLYRHFESKDELRRRIDEAAKYVPIENLCLSPQCGFASTHHGNKLSEEQQWRNAL